jgi:glycogen phosphorylase
MTVNVKVDSPNPGGAVAALRAAVLAKLIYSLGKAPSAASEQDWFVATALVARDRIVERWIAQPHADNAERRKRVYYLSLEFLLGRQLFAALANFELVEPMRAALADLGVDLDHLRSVEPDPAIGNGGLGRLAACFMESMATLAISAFGYGIRYDHGLFRQAVEDGWQHEYPENWLESGHPWEFERGDVAFEIGFGGRVEVIHREDGAVQYVWHPAEIVLAIAHDTPIVGWRGRHVNTLRLWAARTREPLRLALFNEGDHLGAQAHRVRAESISKVLYPSDATPAGQELRLRQQYFFAAASLQDLVARHLMQEGELCTLPAKAAIQLNDTHPSIAIAELMRILVDLHELPWTDAWRITTAIFSYTNHTLLPEALESWPVALMERLLPRHMQIIYLINAVHLDELRAAGHAGRLAALSLIDEHHDSRVRMGHLAFLGSHKVNGVSALHTDLMRHTVFRDLHDLYPDRIVNKTNGVNFRRWLFEANPGLTRILLEAVGQRLLDDPSALEALAPLADDAALHAQLLTVRRAHKVALANLIAERLEIAVDPDALFDVQIKRIHEYKRQLLNLLETIALYNAIRANPSLDWVPRVKILAGKAATNYQQAKLIIKLANDVARVVNADRSIRGLLRVVFLPNYNVSLAEAIIPAADLSEQISTAGMEASGTGNMKLALNGALTIGTLDGANIEIRDRVGDANIFIFGLTAAQVEGRRAQGIDARETIAASPMIAEALEALASGMFSPDDSNRFRSLVDALTFSDYFLVTGDFDAYFATQRAVDARWIDRPSWWRSSVLNTAHVGWFSSDRAIREYAEDIWRVATSSAV